jgi:hypothetical protein
MLRRWIAVAFLIGMVGACGPFCGNGKLNLSNAKMSPTTFTCPSGAQDYGYDIKGSVDADNQTSKKITIKSMSTTAEIIKLVGDNWSAAVGDKSGADNIDFSPKSIDSGSRTTFKFSTPWDCSDSGSNSGETYADFKLVLNIVTDTATYKVTLPNHRMKMA